MTRHSYVTLIRHPGLAARFGAVFASAIALGMMSLTIVLCVARWTDSTALAGATSGLFNLGNAAGIAIQGRFLDRSGARAVLCGAGGLCVAAVVVFVLAGAGGGASPLVLGSAAVAGVSVPALTAAVRAWLPTVLRRDAERTASYALLSVAFQAAVAVGPLVVSACVVLAGPELAAAAAAALVGAATVLYVARSDSSALAPRDGGTAADARTSRHSRTLTPGLGLVLGLTAATGAGFGSLLVTVPTTMTARGTPALAGVAFAAVALGEVGGALVYGAQRWRTSRVRRLSAALMLLGAAYGTAALVVDVDAGLVGALMLSGAAGGPVAIMLSALLDDVVEPGGLGRAYATLVSANLVAIAGGSAVAGLVADTLTPSALLAGPAALSLLAAGAALLGRVALSRRSA